MFGLRRVTVCVLFVGLLGSFLCARQAKSTDATEKGSHDIGLELKTSGEAKLSTGRRGAFRIYTSSNGTEAKLAYGQFPSIADAKRQIRDWLTLAREIKSKEEQKENSGREVRERIVAIGRDAKSGGKEFLIIRMDGLNCYLIESPSLEVAVALEELTK